MLTKELADVLVSLQPVDLDEFGIPRPHFLRRVAVLNNGRKVVGEICFPASYEPIAARRMRVNAAECLHAAWNAAHLIGHHVGARQLRATSITVVPGRRPVRAEKSLLLIAELPELERNRGEGHGTFTAQILELNGRVLQTITADFWTRFPNRARARLG